MASSSSRISTLAEFNEQLDTLQRAADSSNSGQPGRIPMGQIFQLAKDFMDASPEDIEALLDSPSHPRRVAAVSIMDFQARRKATRTAGGGNSMSSICDDTTGLTAGILSTVRHHMSLAATCGISRGNRSTCLPPLPHWYERRTSIVSTWFFIRRGDLDDTFRIGQILANDPHELVQKAVGGWIREAGKRDEQRLRDYLDRNAATMPRTALRYAIELCRQRFAIITSAASTTERLEAELEFDSAVTD